MSHKLQKESTDIDNPGRKEGSSPFRPKENGIHLYPVSVNDPGEGLPCAPEDWPNPGDKWVWKAGKRITVSGFFMDRYLYLPCRFRQAGQGRCFAMNPVSAEIVVVYYAAGLFYKAHDTHSYIRCEATMDGYICGHNCHIDCALCAYMAGTVRGSIGLEVEYYCRRCDSRTDLVSHVTKLLQTCESLDSRDDIEKILSVGICVLRESKKTSAHQLLNSLKKAMSKGYLNHQHDQSDVYVSLRMVRVLKIFGRRKMSLQLLMELGYILEERLSIQKDHIINLYQLDKERLELSLDAALKDQDSVLDSVLCRIKQMKRELSTLKDMEEVSKGFGRVSKHILEEQFGVGVKH